MSKQITELAIENQEYFRGKELRFEDNVTFDQCIKNPLQPNAFISAQTVKRTCTAKRNADHELSETVVKEKLIQMHTLLEDNLLFNAHDTDYVSYATTEQNFKLSENMEEAEVTLISFWTKD